MPDGSLRIKTKLDNDGIDKDVQALENKIKKLQLDNSNLSKQQNSLQEIINKYDELTQRVEEYKSKMQSLQYIDKNGMIDTFRLSSSGNPEFDSVMVDAVKKFQPYTTQFIEEEAFFTHQFVSNGQASLE